MIEQILQWQYAWPWAWWLLPLPLLALLLPPARSAQAQALRAPFAGELAAMAAKDARSPRLKVPLLPLLAWLALCMALARPQELGEAIQPPQSGRDLLLAVDLSGSMQARDMQLGRQIVDRLTAVKAVLSDFLDRRVGDRVGLLLFGQRAYAVTPLTLDRDSVRQQLIDSEVGLAGQETAIGDAIGLAVKRLQQPASGANEAQPAQKVVILLTDGVNTAGAIAPVRAAELAAQAGVRVHTIGFGGDQVDSFFGVQMTRRAEIDEATLQRIADTTGGRYFRARDTRELVEIYAELDRIEPVAREGIVVQPRHERYAWPLAVALILGVLTALLPLVPRPRPA